MLHVSFTVLLYDAMSDIAANHRALCTDAGLADPSQPSWKPSLNVSCNLTTNMECGNTFFAYGSPTI